MDVTASDWNKSDGGNFAYTYKRSFTLNSSGFTPLSQVTATNSGDVDLVVTAGATLPATLTAAGVTAVVVRTDNGPATLKAGANNKAVYEVRLMGPKNYDVAMPDAKKITLSFTYAAA
ncbi:hypothetical protein [Streptomyces sp. NPDC005251]|uniref:hypothetical protein n=1 Tax=unclassified Streptomyces TaxID=2593676 RepID=UPI0033A77BBD